MLKVTKILVLGSNTRSTNICGYLLEQNYHVSIGNVLSNKKETLRIGQEEQPFSYMKNFDLVISAGNSYIFAEKDLKLPSYGMLTCHAGILPEYRGSSPLSWSIINGEKFVGLSVIRTTAEIDGGDIYCSARYDIHNLHCIDDLHRLADENFRFLVHTAILNIENEIPPVKQLSNFEGYFPLRNRNDSRIKFSSMSAKNINLLYKSYSPRYGYPFFVHKNQSIAVCTVNVRNGFNGVAGKIYQILDNKLLIACKNDAVWLSLDEKIDMSLFSRYDEINDHISVS